MTVILQLGCIKIKRNVFSAFIRRYSKDNKWKILFFGTDNFSLRSLSEVYNEYILGNRINTLEVVTNVKSRSNTICKFATQNKLPIHGWPLTALPDNRFDLGIVVSFGHLIPERIIKCFPLGILNVHASLLPRWRGAAPIIHALLNGDTKTGITIMKIRPKHFDIGEILIQKELQLRDDVLQPELHETLADLGAKALVECIRGLPDCLNIAQQQNENLVTYAPKIAQSLAKIDWKEQSAVEIYNLSRALHGIYPLLTNFKNMQVKLFNIRVWKNEEHLKQIEEKKLPGHFVYIKNRRVIRVWCSDGQSIYFDSVSLPGKKCMTAIEFKNGFMKNIPINECSFSKID